MTTIAGLKQTPEKWTPTWALVCTLKNGTTYYWSTNSFAWTVPGNGSQTFSAVLSGFGAIKMEGQGIYGIDAVQELDLEFSNADHWMDSILDPAVWQGGVIQPFFFYHEPRAGTATSDSIAYPKFILDLPTETWPIVKCTAYNKWNMARKSLPVSTISKHDRYPFPSTAAERLAAATDPTSPFFAIGYNPDTPYFYGVKTPGGGYFVGEEQGESDEIVYDGTRDPLSLSSIHAAGLSVRWGGQSDVPLTDTSFVAKKGQEKAILKGSSNPAKYGQAIPILLGIGRVKGILLDTGGSPSGENWGGARLSHFLLCDGVNFADAINNYGCLVETATWQPIVWLTGGADGKEYQIPWRQLITESHIQGGYTIYPGQLGSQKSTNPDEYRNIIKDESDDADYHPPDFKTRDLYSGLCFLEVGIPTELAMAGSDTGPGVEVSGLLGLKIETLGAGPGYASTWEFSQNPVWQFIHLLKLIGWTWTDIDKASAYAAAVKCDTHLAGGQDRFRSNLYLDKAYKAGDVLRGLRNNCRMYTSYGIDGQLEIGIEDTTAGEGGSYGEVDETVILRDDKGFSTAKKFHKSIYELGNQWTIRFQDEYNTYREASYTKSHLEHINQIGETIDGSSMFPVLGCPGFEQAERLARWMAYKTINLNEFYTLICSYDMIDAQVGKIYTITEPRLGLSGQEARLLSKIAGPLDNSVELIFQKHADAAYSDTEGIEPVVKARSDTTFTPRSVANLTAEELFIQDPTNMDVYQQQVRLDFAVPPNTFERFETRTNIDTVSVQTTGGTIPGDQTLYIEVCPQLDGVDGAASDWRQADIPAGTNTNKFTFELTLPEEASHYVIRIGTHPGMMYEHSTVANTESGVPFTVTVTSIAALDNTSLSPDSGFDHVRFFYYFSGSPKEVHDAGRTEGPTDTSFTFAPKLPESGDTSITVIACSTDRREKDFFPLGSAPTATVTLTLDTGNPSGANTLFALTTQDDDRIPPGCAAFQFDRDTSNYNTIKGVALVVSEALPAEGPYEEERDGHPTCIIETGTCTVVAGSKTVLADRPSDYESDDAVIDRVLCIFVDDVSPDSDLEGELIDDADASSFTVHTPFHKSGTFAYAVIKRWWDLATPDTGNTLYFWFPVDQFGSVNQGAWRTPIIPLPPGDWYATAYSRNMFGVGTRITCGFTVADSSTPMDDILPSFVSEVTVTTYGTRPLHAAKGSFSISWIPPVDGASSLCDVCIQYDTVATFDSANVITIALGHWATYTGLYLPGKSLYWRVAAKNLSPLSSNGVVESALNDMEGYESGGYPGSDIGWGPFCSYVGPYTTDEIVTASVIRNVLNAGGGIGISMFSPDTSRRVQTPATVVGSGARPKRPGTAWFDPAAGNKPYRSTGPNSWIYSEDLTQADYTKTYTTISANATEAPDGETTADKLVEAVDNGLHYMQRTMSGCTNSINQTISFFAKLGNIKPCIYVYVVNKTGAAVVTGYVNLSTGATWSVSGNLTVESEGNGWWRIVVVFSAGTGGTTPFLRIYLTDADNNAGAYVGDVNLGNYFWGFQFQVDDSEIEIYDATVASAHGTWEAVQDTSIATALNAANNAQNTANGKVKTFRQDTAPTEGDGLTSGDLWFDTDDLDKGYRWDGANWTQILVRADYVVANIEVASPTITGGTIRTSNGTGERFVITGNSATQYNSANVAVFEALSGGDTKISKLNAANCYVGGSLYTFKSSVGYRVFEAGSTITLNADTFAAGSNYKVEGNQVLGTRKTGWTAPAGNANRASFNTTTANVQEVAEALKALIDDFISHGAIGT